MDKTNRKLPNQILRKKTLNKKNQL